MAKIWRVGLFVLLGTLGFLGTIELALQFYAKKISLKTKATPTAHKLRILCLGDSITLGERDQKSYPDFLQKMLTQTTGQKVQVINAGIAGATSDFLLAKVDDWIKEYQPQVVVAMMGHNDDFHLASESSPTFFSHFKLPKFFVLLSEKFQDQNDFSLIKHFYARSSGQPFSAPLSLEKNLATHREEAEKALARFDYSSVKKHMLTLSSQLLNFPFLHWVEAAWQLRQDPEIHTLLTQLWKKARPEHPDFWNLFSYLYHPADKGILLKKFRQLLQEFPQKAPPLSWTSSMLTQHGLFSPARELFAQDFKLHGMQATTLSSYVHFLLEQNEFTQAEMLAQKMLKENSELKSQALLLLGQSRGQQKKYLEALNFFQQTKNAQWLAQTYSDLKRPRQTLLWSKKMLEENPRSWWAHRLQAEALEQLGHKEEALTHFQQATRLAPSNRHAYLALLQAQKIRGDEAGWTSTLWKAQENCPEMRPMFLTMLKEHYQEKQDENNLAKIALLEKEKKNFWQHQSHTHRNYFKLWQKLQSTQSTLVILSYPGEANSEAKDFFAQYENVMVVEMERPLQEWKKHYQEKDLFLDMAGGVMGHLTPLGHELLAGEVAKALDRVKGSHSLSLRRAALQYPKAF